MTKTAFCCFAIALATLLASAHASGSKSLLVKLDVSGTVLMPEAPKGSQLQCCMHFTLEVFSDMTARYVGFSMVRTLGERVTRITQNQLDGLTEDIRVSRVSDLPAAEPFAIIPDDYPDRRRLLDEWYGTSADGASTTRTLTIVKDGGKKVVSYRRGVKVVVAKDAEEWNVTVDRSLLELEKRLLRIPNVRQWICPLPFGASCIAD